MCYRHVSLVLFFLAILLGRHDHRTYSPYITVQSFSSPLMFTIVHPTRFPRSFNWLRFTAPKFITSPHPPSCAIIGSVERIAVGGKPNRRAAPANTAPFCIQPFTCSPCWVKELSGLTRSLQGEINANDILLHISFQSGPVVSCTGVKLLPSCPELPFHSVAQA